MTEPVGPPSDDRFSWTLKAGGAISLPPLSELDPDLGATEDLSAALAAAGDNEMMAAAAQMRFLARGLPDGDAVTIRRIKLSEFGAFMKAWAEHSGVELGE